MASYRVVREKIASLLTSGTFAKLLRRRGPTDADEKKQVSLRLVEQRPTEAARARASKRQELPAARSPVHCISQAKGQVAKAQAALKERLELGEPRSAVDARVRRPQSPVEDQGRAQVDCMDLGSPLDARIRSGIEGGEPMRAATEALLALGPEVLGFLTRVLGSESEADEVFAATSERFWRSLSHFRWRCSLRTFMYVLARQEIARHRQGEERHGRERVSASELDKAIAHVASRSRSTQRLEREDALNRLRKELAEEDRVILVLRVDRGLSWHEIALCFLDDPGASTEEERRHKAAWARERFQQIKEHLTRYFRN